MIIRLATLADLPVIAKLVEHGSAELETKYGTPRMDATLVACIKHGIETKQAVVVAEQPQWVEEFEVVGWCARVRLPTMPDGYAEALGTYVWEPFRKERVSADMRKFADEYAKSIGIKFLTGVVAKDNVAGIESALKDGWEVPVGYAGRKAL